MANETRYEWVERARAHGMGGIARAVLTGIKPLGVLGAQLLYVIQPASAAFGLRQTVGELAEALEDPEAFEDMLERLNDDPR
jgi:hypothetical protein